MSVIDDVLPPVPVHTELLAVSFQQGTNPKINNQWGNWFNLLRTKVNVLNDSITTLAGTSGAGIPKADGLGGWTIGIVPIVYGGTNITTYTVGDILYCSATNVLSKLAVGTNGYVLTIAFGVPSWAASAGGVASGTSFPGSPNDNDVFFRTDLDLLCFYSTTGTRWMTVSEYTLSGQPYVLPPYSATSTAPVRYVVPSDYGIYLTRMLFYFYVLTTNNGSNYWTFNLYQYTAAEVQIGGSLGTSNSSAGAADTILNGDVAINTALGATAKVLYPVLTKVSSPGNLYPSYSLLYRKIIT